MKICVFLVLLFSLACHASLLDYGRSLQNTQFLYNQNLDYIFTNGQKSKLGGVANVTFYQKLNDLMTTFCQNGFEFWATNFPPAPYTTFDQVSTAYVGYSLNMYYNYSHHELHNVRIIGPYFQNGYFYANLTSMLVQYAKADYSSFALPEITNYRIEGFYNNMYRYDFDTDNWCMVRFYAYTQSIFGPNGVDYVNAPYFTYDQTPYYSG